MRKFALTGPTFLASGPCTDPWGLGKCAWNKPPGPWWSWSTSPSPATLASLPQAHTLRSGYFWGGRESWLWDTSVPYSCSCPHDAFQPPVGKSQPENYLSWPGSGEDGSVIGRTVQRWGELTGAHCCFSPFEISYFLLPTFPIPHCPQKHTLTTPTPSLCFDTSLDPEAAMDTLFIVLLTQGLM